MRNTGQIKKTVKMTVAIILLSSSVILGCRLTGPETPEEAIQCYVGALSTGKEEKVLQCWSGIDSFYLPSPIHISKWTTTNRVVFEKHHIEELRSRDRHIYQGGEFRKGDVRMEVRASYPDASPAMHTFHLREFWNGWRIIEHHRWDQPL